MVRQHTSLILASILACAATAFDSPEGGVGPDPGRVADRRSIEMIYWNHRHWPAANRAPKPDLASVLSDAVVEGRVADDLRKRAALERFWGRRLTSAQVQAEIDRMAARTRDPRVLTELFAALGNDPQRIAVGLAEPALVDRLIRSWYAADDRLHETVKRRAERAAERLRATEDLSAADGDRIEVTYRLGDDRAPSMPDRPATDIVLEPSDWAALLTRLAAAFESDGVAGNRPEALPLRVTSRLADEGDAYRVYRVLEAGRDRIRVASVAWPKRPFEDWWREARASLQPTPAPITGRYTLPALAVPCVDDTWSPIMTNSPAGRANDTAVWTGSEMIIWGGSSFGGSPLGTGARYNPATDTWMPTGIDAWTPAARTDHTAVWTGTRMIIWGGGTVEGQILSAFRSGGRYDPQADAWLTVRDDATAPSLRVNHAAIWTGTRMIVWGGGGSSCNCGYTNTGALYDPETDTWTPTRADPTAPEGRAAPTAVWTGDEVIFWGGYRQGAASPAAHFDVDTGGRYDPSSDSWVLIQGGGVRSGHSAIWTGNSMVVWGGLRRVWNNPTQQDIVTLLRSGSRYDPGADSWAPSSITSITPTARAGHTSVWSGSEMIVWGGSPNPGARYLPEEDEWSPMNPGAAFAQSPGGQTAVWTGTEMIVWGCDASLRSGGRYDPENDTWAPTPVTAAFGIGSPPQGKGVWTGSEMIVWSRSDSSGRYDPATDHWSSMTGVDEPATRTSHTAIWTGTEMIVWGGVIVGSDPTNSGGAYDPTVDDWTPTTFPAAPVSRYLHTAVWTGSRMIVWGGYGCCLSGQTGYQHTGSRYDPITDLWAATRADGTEPVATANHSAVWTGDRMIVWGGANDSLPGPPFARRTGGSYDPVGNTWELTPFDASTPDARYTHTAVWTGTEMIIWGGFDDSAGPPSVSPTGWALDPAANSWRPIEDDATAPEGRTRHAAVWTGEEMIVWGGSRDGSPAGALRTGGRYNPATDSWTATRVDGSAPGSRVAPASVWTGSGMLVWGGLGTTGTALADGGAYCAECPHAAWYLDADGDGHGDPAQSASTCSQPEGYVTTGDDCSDLDSQAWATPTEALDLRFSSAVALAWTPPTAPGALSPTYDLIRSGDRADFAGAGTCVASGSPETTALDADTPSPGQGFYYRVRAVNACPGGSGPLGTTSNGTPVPGPACP